MQELKRKHSSQSYFLVHHQVIQGSLSSFIIISTGYSSLYVPSFTYHNSSLVTGIKQCFSPTFTLYQLLGWAAWFRSPIYCDAVTEMLSVYSSQSLSITACTWAEALLLLLLTLSWCRRTHHQKGDSVLLPQSTAQPMTTAAETVTR